MNDRYLHEVGLIEEAGNPRQNGEEKGGVQKGGMVSHNHPWLFLKPLPWPVLRLQAHPQGETENLQRHLDLEQLRKHVG